MKASLLVLAVISFSNIYSASGLCDHPFGFEGDEYRDKDNPCVLHTCTYVKEFSAEHWILSLDPQHCCVHDEYMDGHDKLVSLYCMKHGDAPPSIEVKVSTLEGDTTKTEETTMTGEKNMREEKANPDCEEEHKSSARDPKFEGRCVFSGGWHYFRKGNKCYRVFNDQAHREKARQRCHVYQDGELASVPDNQTNAFLGSLIRENRWVLLGGYKDRAHGWHWYDGSSWDFENWGKYGKEPSKDEPFPTSTNIVGYGPTNGWAENQGFFPYICQSSTGDFDTSRAKDVKRDDQRHQYWEGRMYEPLVGMAAFMSQHNYLPRGLITIEGFILESKVVLTGEVVGASGNAGSGDHYLLTLVKLSERSCDNVEEKIVKEVRLETWDQNTAGNIRVVGSLENKATIIPQEEDNRIKVSRCKNYALIIRSDYPKERSIKGCALIEWLS